MKLKLNMTRCKHWKNQYFRYFSFLYCPAAAQASVQWLNSRANNHFYVDDKGEVDD